MFLVVSSPALPLVRLVFKPIGRQGLARLRAAHSLFLLVGSLGWDYCRAVILILIH
jgi:hypothetical protein